MGCIDLLVTYNTDSPTRDMDDVNNSRDQLPVRKRIHTVSHIRLECKNRYQSGSYVFAQEKGHVLSPDYLFESVLYLLISLSHG